MQRKSYKSLTIPQLQWDASQSSDLTGELIVEPLEAGFGITLGNALRRVMLSSVEGSAVTSIVIKGINNEFSTVKGVIEDVLHMILNIKGIVIKNNTGEPGKMTLNCSGEMVAKSGDIIADDHLEVLNKDHIIANLGKDAELSIEFAVEMGRGYVAAQWPRGESLQEDGRIYIDAMFSPVRRVEYTIEKTRVGREINYDKLRIRIHTNGAMHPQDIVHYGTSVLRTQFEHFLSATEIPFNEISQVEEVDTTQDTFSDHRAGAAGIPVDLFLKPIDELEFSVRAHNCLLSSGVKRIIDLVNLSDDELLKIKNLGRKSLREVKEILAAFNLRLGMNIKELDLKKMIKEQETDGTES
ncbi:DNA-directed RNA polymerase subunit alpha [Candidatus Dependentiae bacterium]|nr:MAG: DNA-directed RNA polymerase subunit alpha [Candidatus Dependentiae bacterium]